MKFKELTTKSAAEIKSLLTELQIKAHDLAVKTRLNQLKNNHEIKVVKKDIARILTYISNKWLYKYTNEQMIQISTNPVF